MSKLSPGCYWPYRAPRKNSSSRCPPCLELNDGKISPRRARAGNSRPNQIRGGIERLRHQIAELEAFDPSSVRVRGAAETRAIQSAIAMTLAKTFGDATSEHDRYASAARLDNGPMYLSGRPPVELVVGWIRDGKARSLALLQQAVTDLQNELVELEDAAAEQSLASEPAKLVTRDDALLVTGTDMEQNGGDVVAASAGEARENLAARKDVKDASEPANEFSRRAARAPKRWRFYQALCW